MNTARLHSASWKDRYEELRRHVLETHDVLEAQPLSLVLLIDRGVAGWMRSWVASAENTQPPNPPPGPGCPPASAWQEQLTMLLAQMTLPHINNSRNL